MSVRAKFRVDSIEASPNVQPTDEALKTVKLSAVTSGSPENAEFFKWTPSGQITLSTINPAASAQFEQGSEFYVDFTKVEAES